MTLETFTVRAIIASTFVCLLGAIASIPSGPIAPSYSGTQQFVRVAK